LLPTFLHTAVTNALARFEQEQKQVELDYQKKQQELATAIQKAAYDEQLAHLELEKQKFELERQHLLLQIDLDRQKLELERQQVALQREQAELENTRMTYAIEAANKMVTMLAPSANQATRTMLIQSLLPNILQLHAIPNVTITLPLPSQGSEKLDTDTSASKKDDLPTKQRQDE
jgi:hypothetical protein